MSAQRLAQEWLLQLCKSGSKCEKSADVCPRQLDKQIVLECSNKKQ